MPSFVVGTGVEWRDDCRCAFLSAPRLGNAFLPVTTGEATRDPRSLPDVFPAGSKRPSASSRPLSELPLFEELTVLRHHEKRHY